MKIQVKNIDDLIFADYNPRQLTADQFDDLKTSIEEFGVVEPILINKNKERENIIIGGHQRVRIAKSLGLKEIPCYEIDLNIDREKELNIRLNKNTGEWNFDELANNFDITDLLDWGFEDYELGVHSGGDIDVSSEWEGMPEYDNEDISPHRTLKLHFRNDADIKMFSKLLKQNITNDTKSLWYPKLEKEVFVDKEYLDVNEA